MTMDGMASTRNIHFHPDRPRTPFRPSRLPESGPPITDDIGMATRNQARMRARNSDGNQPAR